MNFDFNKNWDYYTFQFWQELYRSTKYQYFKWYYYKEMEKASFKLVNWNELSKKL